MVRLELVRNATGCPELEELYAEIVDHGFGTRVPINWFTAQGSRPDIVASSWSLAKGVLLNGKLPGTIKQLIALTVSRYNDCRYCEIAHRGTLEAMGVPKGVIERCLDDPELADIPPPHRAILLFALKVAQDPGSVDDGDYRTLRDHGLGDEELVEIVMMAALTNFINTWAEATGLPLDSETAGG